MLLQSVDQLVSTWGPLAVFLFVMIESSGIPFPGETMLLAGAVYAGLGHVGIQWIVAGAAGGAIFGDNLGYWAGHSGGYQLLRRFGKYVHLTEERLAWAERFYQRHGSKTVFFGRFFSILRTWAAFLAGTNRMPWAEFLFFNALGGIIWAAAYGTLGYELARNVPLLHSILRNWGIASGALVVLAVIGLALYMMRRRLLARGDNQTVQVLSPPPSPCQGAEFPPDKGG